ncbi:MAG: chemotaxis protein CheW [Rhodospirillaceae bacterium]
MPNLVIFEVAGQTFALPAEAHDKEVAPVPVTPLPFVAGNVEGMISAGGVIVAQIDLARRVGLTPRPNDPSILMLVRINGRLVALRVSTVVTKTVVSADDIHPPDAGSEQCAGSFIEGEFCWQNRTVSLLRLDKLGLESLTPIKIGRPVAVLGDVDKHNAPVSAGSSPGGPAMVRCLVVRCGSEQFALPFDQVQEVITTDRLTVMPHAPAEILGLTVVRGTPVPAVSLGRLLGKDAPAGKKAIPMALVRHKEHTVALAVDAIQGMRRLDDAAIHSLAEARAGISGYHIDARESLTGIVDLDSLFATPAGERLRSFMPNGRSAESRPAPVIPEPERRFLTFLIGSEMFGIDLDRVERIAEHREPMPLPGRRHAALASMVDIAGNVVPVADLRKPLGRPATVTRRTAFVLARGSRGIWALVVDRLARIVKIPVSAIKATGSGPHFIGEIARVERALMPIVNPLALDSFIG